MFQGESTLDLAARVKGFWNFDSRLFSWNRQLYFSVDFNCTGILGQIYSDMKKEPNILKFKCYCWQQRVHQKFLNTSKSCYASQRPNLILRICNFKGFFLWGGRFFLQLRTGFSKKHTKKTFKYTFCPP